MSRGHDPESVKDIYEDEVRDTIGSSRSLPPRHRTVVRCVTDGEEEQPSSRSVALDLEGARSSDQVSHRRISRIARADSSRDDVPRRF